MSNRVQKMTPKNQIILNLVWQIVYDLQMNDRGASKITIEKKLESLGLKNVSSKLIDDDMWNLLISFTIDGEGFIVEVQS